MARIQTKEYTRRGKGGKIVRVSGYEREGAANLADLTKTRRKPGAGTELAAKKFSRKELEKKREERMGTLGGELTAGATAIKEKPKATFKATTPAQKKAVASVDAAIASYKKKEGISTPKKAKKEKKVETPKTEKPIQKIEKVEKVVPKETPKKKQEPTKTNTEKANEYWRDRKEREARKKELNKSVTAAIHKELAEKHEREKQENAQAGEIHERERLARERAKKPTERERAREQVRSKLGEFAEKNKKRGYEEETYDFGQEKGSQHMQQYNTRKRAAPKAVVTVEKKVKPEKRKRGVGSRYGSGFGSVVRSQAEREVARKALREVGIMQKGKEDVVEKTSSVSTSGGKMAGTKKGKAKTTYKGKKAKSVVTRKKK